MTNNEMIRDLSISEIFSSANKYSIPFYQRNFAWGYEQISRLLQDIYSSYEESRNCKEPSPYFIGSLIVKKISENEYEVIDGQQRLTVFTLLTRLLNITNENDCVLSYMSRKNENKFLEEYYKDPTFYENKEYQKANDEFIKYNDSFIKAIHYLKTCSLTVEEIQEKKTLEDLIKNDKKEEYNNFREYIKNKIIILRTILPENTNVASYFEIMNNRGKQLQTEEILKSLIMSSLQNSYEKQNKFSKIWDACYQMHIPIQKSFSSNERDFFFGNNWSDFISFQNFQEWFSSSKEDAPQETIGISFKDILKSEEDPFSKQEQKTNDEINGEGDEENIKYKSIIDFSNFILQVFKILYDPEIVLDERKLLPMYTKVRNKVKPEEFIYYLFFYRTLFDRFVLKTEDIEGDSNEDENFYWRLLQPKKDKYKKKESDKEYYRLRYNTNSELSDDFYKILSMLQVTFRNRRYKNYLTEVLKFLETQYKEKESISYMVSEKGKKEYKKKLFEILEDHFKKNYYNQDGFDWNSYMQLGTSTPQFLFNYIDLLYWFAHTEEGINLPKELHDEIDLIKMDFVFRYYNSVEHHFARNYLTDQKEKNPGKYDDITPDFLNIIGNLILLSRSSNSRLSDVSPYEKASKRSGDEINKGPNRQIIYKITEDNNSKGQEWAKDSINAHTQNIKLLLEKRNEIIQKVYERNDIVDNEE